MDLSYYEWVKYGMDKGWCSEAVCVTHDGLPSTDSEMDEWEDGSDPCEFALRLWPEPSENELPVGLRSPATPVV